MIFLNSVVRGIVYVTSRYKEVLLLSIVERGVHSNRAVIIIIIEFGIFLLVTLEIEGALSLLVITLIQIKIIP